MEKKAVVTGANGFVGRHLVKELVENGYFVTAVIRENSKYLDVLKGYENVSIVYCELEDAVNLPEYISNDIQGAVFFHLAWEGHFGDKRKDYALQLKNAKNAVDMAVSASRMGCVRFVVSGSVTQLMYRDYLRENGIHPEMVTCYSVGKMSAEAMLKCICPNLEIQLIWAYISNFYGEDDNTANFINFLIDTYLKGEIPVLTSGEQFADFMHVDDVACALRILGEMDEDNKSIYIGYGCPRPLKEYIKIIHDAISPENETGIGGKPFSGHSIDYQVIDYKEFQNKTGFHPSISFDEGIRRVINVRKDKINNNE